MIQLNVAVPTSAHRQRRPYCKTADTHPRDLAVPQHRKGTSLTRKQILAWCEAHRQRTGRYPARTSGPVDEDPAILWALVDRTLARGNRHLPGGETLARFLMRELDVGDRRGLRTLTRPMILEWAEAHHERTGRWPVTDSNSHVPEPIPESPGDTWRIVDAAMRRGGRGYRGPRSLFKLLSQHYGERYQYWLAPLSVRQIIEWAESHKARTGRWPVVRSGAIPESPPNTWCRINDAIIHSRRGLLGGITLAQLLARHRRRQIKARTRPPRRHPPRLRVEQVLHWAGLHKQRTGRWPQCTSGVIHDAPQETWNAIHGALRYGCRGLPAGGTLAKLLSEHRGAPIKPTGRVTVEQVIAWADACHDRTGQWPTRTSGPIGLGINGTWGGLQNALQKGLRDLPHGSSLSQLLYAHRNVGRPPPRRRKPRRRAPRHAR